MRKISALRSATRPLGAEKSSAKAKTPHVTSMQHADIHDLADAVEGQMRAIQGHVDASDTF